MGVKRLAGRKTSGKRRNKHPWLRLLGIIFLFLSIFGFLGTFGISSWGISLSSFLRLILGGFAWIGPYLFLGIAFYLWVNSWEERPPKEAAVDRHALPLPPTKLVTLKGFNQYFTSETWSDVDPASQPTIAELGKDFSTYFGEGEASYKPPVHLTSLRGFRTYFDNAEELSTSEPNEKAWEEKIGEEHYPAQIAGLRERLKGTIRAPLNRVEPGSLDPEQSEAAREFRREILSRENEAILVMGEPEESCHASGAEEGSSISEQEKRLSRGEKEVGPNHIRPETIPLRREPELSLSSREAEMPVLQPEASVPGGRPEAERPRKNWKLPDLELLEPQAQVADIQETDTPKLLEGVLQDFGVKAKVIRVACGPVITRYELAPAPGVKISRIVNLADDIALALAARDVRIEAPIPGKAAIGIEIPNKRPRAVTFREVLDTSAYRQNSSRLKVTLGKDIGNQAIVGDLSKMPHLLVAGATGSGKSVCITSIINSLLFNAKPDEVRFLLIDPKMVELNLYNGVPHLLAPVVTDPQKAAVALKWIVKEMETRYELFAAAGVRDIARYNQAKLSAGQGVVGTLPFILVIIDELADLMLVAPGDVEEAICRLAQMARAAGIHLVIATQRPSVDVITGVIKANIPSRISFAVSSQIDSRTILDAVGAEKLIGKGDMLYSPLGVTKPMRVQGCLVTDDEVERIIQHWKAQGKPEYLDPESLFAETGRKGEENNGLEDDLFVDAGKLLINTGMASVTFLQRRMKLGYARAARIMDMLEEQGVVGPYEGSKPRQILISIEEFEERFG